MVERGKPNKGGGHEEIEILPDDVLPEEDIFDEDGDIPDNDEPIIGANNGADDEEEHETYERS